ncbi:MAG: hypothetical protein IJW12_08045 [Opitutales bacterium]|nr:hypothetical protein [Opitutales bacterium]
MRNKRVEFILKAKIGFLSWWLQILFALWIFALFVLFAKMNYGADDLAQISVDKIPGVESAFVLPERLIAPNPPTE